MRDRSEVRSPTRTEVRSPTRTSTHANTRGNFTSTVTGGAGAGETSVTINIPRQTPHDTGGPMNHWHHLLHHHYRDTGWMRGSSDASGLADSISALPSTTKTVMYTGAGALLGHLAGKHALLGGLLGLAGGIYLANKAAANSNPNIPST